MDTLRVLRRLMRACLDDERTLLREGKLVDARRAVALERMAHQRDDFLVSLEALAAHRRPSTGTWSDLLREAWRDLWVVLAGRNNGDAIATCRQSNARMEARYDVALRGPWSKNARRLLESQRAMIEGERTELNQLQF
jgi:hypothetical protein